MILTLTPDPALDKILFIPAWQPGIPMRAERTQTSVGGKGLDASVALTHLDVPTQAIACIAGSAGRELQELVSRYGIPLHAVWTAGETRTALIIAELEEPRHSHIFSGGLQCGPTDAETLLARLSELHALSKWLVMGGVLPDSLPEDLFGVLCTEARRAGLPVLIDAHSAYLRTALPARPDIAKLNWKEFEWTFGLAAPSFRELVHAAAQVYRAWDLQALVVTCAEEGLLALTPQGAFQAQAPTQTVVNAAGAGDAVSGALAWRLAFDAGWEDALCWAAAAGAAVVRTPGTADLELEVVEELLPQVQVKRLSLEK